MRERGGELMCVCMRDRETNLKSIIVCVCERESERKREGRKCKSSVLYKRK